MKIISNTSKFAFIALFTSMFISCSKNEDSAADLQASQDPTIEELASKNPDLSSLYDALTETNLVNEFNNNLASRNGKSEFTLFAPTNKAFREFFKSNPKANLRNVLLNHVLSSKKMAADLSTGYLSTRSQVKIGGGAKNNLSLFVDITSGVLLNGVSNVVKADIKLANGVVHIVDKVIPLPTIVTHASANKNFSTLLSVVTSPDQKDIAVALTTNKKPLTVFAPINTAFDAALGAGGFANGATAAQVTSVLLYHVVGDANVLAASLKEGQVVSTLLKQDFTISLTGGASIKDQAGNKVNIIATDVQCTNGVIHAIDRVLQPKL
jgi:uncharacterized surface protein with fasciclin (FAS1) repeats